MRKQLRERFFIKYNDIIGTLLYWEGLSSMILDIIGTTSSFGVGFFSSESLIMIPQEEDQEQRVLPKLRFWKNQAKTLEKWGCQR